MNGFETYGPPNTAPVGCAEIVLPAPTNPNCPNDYNAYESEWTDIWVSPATLNDDGSGTYVAQYLPDDWKDYATLNTTDNLQHLTIIGDKPLGEAIIATLAKRWTKVTDRNHQVNIDVTDMSEENYEFVRTLQHGAKLFIWGWSYGGWAIGGANGILVDVDTAGIVWGRGEGTLMTGQVVFRWRNKYDPPAVIGTNTPSPLKVKKPSPSALTVEGQKVEKPAKEVKAA